LLLWQRRSRHPQPLALLLHQSTRGGVGEIRHLPEPKLNVADAAEIFEISPWAVYEAIKSGEIGAVKIGRLLKIPRHVIERKLAV